MFMNISAASLMKIVWCRNRGSNCAGFMRAANFCETRMVSVCCELILFLLKAIKQHRKLIRALTKFCLFCVNFGNCEIVIKSFSSSTKNQPKNVLLLHQSWIVHKCFDKKSPQRGNITAQTFPFKWVDSLQRSLLHCSHTSRLIVCLISSHGSFVDPTREQKRVVLGCPDSKGNLLSN